MANQRNTTLLNKPFDDDKFWAYIAEEGSVFKNMVNIKYGTIPQTLTVNSCFV